MRGPCFAITQMEIVGCTGGGRNGRPGESVEVVVEQIVVALSPFTRRCRSLVVSHVEQGLVRGLEPGEHVVVHDPEADEHFTAVVADVDFELADTSYRLEVGTRITDAEAVEWLEPPTDDGRLTTQDIVALLEQLRRSERDVTAALAELRAH